jgi:hypothetical protein
LGSQGTFADAGLDALPDIVLVAFGEFEDASPGLHAEANDVPQFGHGGGVEVKAAEFGRGLEASDETVPDVSLVSCASARSRRAASSRMRAIQRSDSISWSLRSAGAGS